MSPDSVGRRAPAPLAIASVALLARAGRRRAAAAALVSVVAMGGATWLQAMGRTVSPSADEPGVITGRITGQLRTFALAGNQVPAPQPELAVFYHGATTGGGGTVTGAWEGDLLRIQATPPASGLYHIVAGSYQVRGSDILLYYTKSMSPAERGYDHDLGPHAVLHHNLTYEIKGLRKKDYEILIGGEESALEENFD